MALYLGDKMIASALAHGGPVGSIIAYAGLTAPDGYLMCDGSAVSRDDYAELFAVIGTTYGSGDGSTTFNLPNTQGRTLVGVDEDDSDFALANADGEKEHLLISEESGAPVHSHSMTHTHSHNHGSSGGDSFVTSSATVGGYTIQTGSGSQTSRYYLGVSASSAYGRNSNTDTDATSSSRSTTVDNTPADAAEAHNNLQPYLALNYIIRVR